MQKRLRSWGMLAGTTVLIFAAGATASAITTLSQSYVTSDKTSAGSIVSLQKDSTNNVSNANPQNVNNIIGVIIASDNSLISISSEQASEVQVATSGIVGVLVSDINGKVYAGDQITASPISGVGMKATTNTKVVGVAQENLTNGTASNQKYKDSSGKEHDVTIGQVRTLVNVSYYFKQPDKTIIPAAIQNVANAFVGKNVKALPIIISMAIFLVTMTIVISIIYSMIHSSIISVGRNPMSQSAVYRNLIQISGLVIVILGVAVVSIYMVLTKL